MKVSVIIPVRNRGKLLRETVRNLLLQSLKPYEIIIVDDNSEEDIEEGIREYLKDVVFLKSPGKGPSAARNKGLTVATGNFIQFFDSDDLMSSNKLETQASLLAENPSAGFVYGPYIKARLENGYWKNTDILMQYRPFGDHPFLYYVLMGWCSVTQACLFTRELVKEVGPWNEAFLTHEDKEYWFRTSLLADTPLHEALSCVLYRQHSDQITNTGTKELERAANDVQVHTLIRSNLPARTPFFYRTMLGGYIANTKNFINIAGRKKEYSLSLQDTFSRLLYKANSRYQRLLTGSIWQPMHGVEKDPEIISRMLSFFNNSPVQE